jgi:ubiquinone biosynthesis protein COQ4
VVNRITVAIHYATTAFADPTRADAVAALGEITGPLTLQRLAQQMKQDPVGRRILQDRPIVSKATIPYDKLISEAPTEDSIDDPTVTFGQAYGYFLKSHDFDPDERDQVRFIDDAELAYIMLRYRQVGAVL